VKDYAAPDDDNVRIHKYRTEREELRKPAQIKARGTFRPSNMVHHNTKASQRFLIKMTRRLVMQVIEAVVPGY
jgi:hypothetical protein